MINELESAVDAALDEMPEEFVLKPFLQANRAELKGMFLTEYDHEKVLERGKKEAMKQGVSSDKAKKLTEGRHPGYGDYTIEDILKLPDGTLAELIDGVIFDRSAPDLVVEVLLKSTKYLDRGLKMWKYYTAGVREYWIVDPDNEKITVYDFEKDVINDYDFSAKVPVGIWDGKLEIDFIEIRDRIRQI